MNNTLRAETAQIVMITCLVYLMLSSYLYHAPSRSSCLLCAYNQT